MHPRGDAPLSPHNLSLGKKTFLFLPATNTPMDSPLLHPYTLFRKGLPSSASALSLRAPRRFAFDGWESPRPSTGSDVDSATAFMKAPLDPPDVPTIQGSPYVKHGSGNTVLLLGQKAGTSFPVYQSGSMLNGMVVLEKPAGIASVDVKLEGSVSVREIQGGGRSGIVFYSDQLISWNATGASLPDEFSFRRIVPVFSDAGRLLPPSFDSRLSAIPGFRVSVNWSIVVKVTRARTSPLSLFRRTTRLIVPIGYVPRTRPPLPGPFPIASTHSSPSQPRTSFIDLVPTRKEHTVPIHTQILLPQSQIMPMTEVIPFRITLSAPDVYLKPFLVTPSQPSFLPLGSGAIPPAPDPTSGPVSVQLVRRIGADPRETFVVVVGELATSFTRGTTLAEGLLSQAEVGQDSVSWWGQLRLPLDLASPGGFVADRLVVQDVLVLTLNVPGMHTHSLPFKQVVPMRLTTDLPGTSDALPVTEV